MIEWIILLIAIIVIGWFVLTYNWLIGLRARIDNAWAQIDVQLKRRYDLIPNLVETVKGYVKHERKTLTDITKYRSQIMKGSPEQRAKANNMLTDTLKSLFAVAENYPKLQANENFKMLQEELAGTENKISYVRTAYNDTVMAYNVAIQRFPTSILAGIFSFNKRNYFEAPETERKAVKVKFE